MPVTYYAVLEEQINLLAQKLTLEYLRTTKGNNSRDSSNNSNCSSDSEKVFIVYKFIHTPIEAIIAGM